MRAFWTKLPKFILCNLSNMKPSVKKNKTPKDGCGKCVCVSVRELRSGKRLQRTKKREKRSLLERTGEKKNRYVYALIYLSWCLSF